MMGSKAVEPKLFLSFDLDAAVPQGHVLRRISEAVDFSFVRDLAQPYYSHTGQPSVDPVVLFKLSLLGYLFGMLSEGRLCEEAGLNLASRWFLGYELDEEIPDHSVLSKARRRFGIKVYEQFFARVVKLCEERGLIQGKVLFLDSTQVARRQSRAGPREPAPPPRHARPSRRSRSPARRGRREARAPEPKPRPARTPPSWGSRAGERPRRLRRSSRERGRRWQARGGR